MVSIFTYLVNLFAPVIYPFSSETTSYEFFDFGILLEIPSLIFVIIAYNKIDFKNYDDTKKFTIFAIIPVFILLLYDFITLIIHFEEVSLTILTYIFDPFYIPLLIEYVVDPFLIIIFILLIKTYNNIRIVKGEKEANETYIDRFYNKA